MTCIFFTAILASCNRSLDIVDPPAKKMDDLNIPSAFNWKTTKEVTLTVNINFLGTPSQQYSKVVVHLDNPLTGGAVLSQGSVGLNAPYAGILSLPSYVSKIYIKLIYPDGQEQLSEVTVEPNITVTMDEVTYGLSYPDTDLDNVPDQLDDFPSDSTKAFQSYFPNRNEYGSVMFEDNWPSKGDYDFNDLVVDYHAVLTTDNKNRVREFKTDFLIRAAGAALKNGFGFQLDKIRPDQVAQATGSSLLNSYILVTPAGLESNQQNAVIVVCDNVDNVIHRPPSSGDFFNTWPGVPKGDADTIHIKVKFAVPQTLQNAGTPPFNMFLIKDMDRGYEVHLPGFVPTNLVYSELFGHYDDNSDPAKGIYYKSNLYLPWGMATPGRFDYTFEQVQVIKGFMHFPEWSQSGGVLIKDWYLNLPGYRDETKIYH